MAVLRILCLHLDGEDMLRAVFAILLMAGVAGCSSARKKYLSRSDISAEEREAVRRRRLIIGMPEAGVQASWGKPCTRRTETTQESQTVLWVYCAVCPSTSAALSIATGRYDDAKCAREKSVTFTDGKVVKFIE